MLDGLRETTECALTRVACSDGWHTGREQPISDGVIVPTCGTHLCDIIETTLFSVNQAGWMFSADQWHALSHMCGML